MHIVNRIPLLFIGEGIKLYLCFYPSNKSIYPWEKKADAKNVFIVFCFLCMYNSGHWHWHFTTLFFFFFTVFIVPSNKQSFPHTLTESNNANLFLKLIPLYSLPMWFQFTTNKNRTTNSCTLCTSAFVWR